MVAAPYAEAARACRTKVPLNFARATARIGAMAEGLRSSAPGWHVAVVDDDHGVRRGVSRLLRAAGFEVTTFESGEAFLACETTFRCLILDVQLTGMTGLELYAQLDRAGRRLPAVFITSHEDYLAGATTDATRIWLRKPFEAPDLIGAIYRVTSADDT